MTDEELLEAAAEAYWRVQSPDLASAMLATLVGVSAPGMRAALEVFRREQVAPVDIDGCAVCGFHCTHDALINAAYQQGLAAARREHGARDEALRQALALLREMQGLPMLRGESGVGATFTVTYKDTGLLDRIDAFLAAAPASPEVE